MAVFVLSKSRQCLKEFKIASALFKREFSYSNYEQSYTLPDDVVKDQISAKVEDGILTVNMPKTEPKEKVTKAIEVS